MQVNDRVTGSWSNVWLPVAILVVAGISAYFNSLGAGFIFDDHSSIIGNERIRSLWPLSSFFSGTSRPFLELTFAINFAFGQLNPWGYHLLNLTIHLCSGVVLFDLIRRTLNTQTLQSYFSARSVGIAFAVALIWVVHPLNTSAVTYIVQRAESLMGLCYLLTVYSVLRSTQTRYVSAWYLLAIVCCALGMATKAVMVTAPVLALLYDRTFLSGSFKEAIRLRWQLYGGLCATWIFLIVLSVQTSELMGVVEPSVGFTLKDISSLEYFLTQPAVILHYLRLSFIPNQLVMDYEWPVAQGLRAILPSFLVVGSCFIAGIWTLRYKKPVGFLCAWFFLILAPTSSFVPILDLAFEHRMYLPLIAVITSAVLCADRVFNKFIPTRSLSYAFVSIGVTACIAVTFATMTYQRNTQYYDEVTMWRDTVAKRPNNARARRILGLILGRTGEYEEARVHFQKAFEIQGPTAELHNNLGLVMAGLGKQNEAVSHYKEAISMDATHADAYSNLGLILMKMNRMEEAIEQYRRAIELSPDFLVARSNLASALTKDGQYLEAAKQYENIIRQQPNNAQAHEWLGVVRTYQGKLDEAIHHYQIALQLQPPSATVHSNIGVAFYRKGKMIEAKRHFRKALELNPNQPQAVSNLKLIQNELEDTVSP